jgi:hypothetical protein
MLEPGAPADFAVIAAAVLSATAGDVRLVVAAGVPRTAAPEVAPYLESAALHGIRMTVGGVTRWANTNP